MSFRLFSQEKEANVAYPERVRAHIHIRNPLVRNCLSEFFGSFMLLFIGLTTIMQLILSGEKMNTWTQINFGWGLGVGFCVYICAKTSGGHYNPAVTMTMVTFGKLPISHFFLYFVVQTAGAFLGAAVGYILYYEQFDHFDGGVRAILGPNGTARCFCSVPDPHISNLTCFFDQICGTGLLVFFVAVIIDKRNKIPEAAHPWLFGFVLVMVGCCMGLNLGYPINPSRDLGPRIFATFIYGTELWTIHNYYFWIPIVAPCIGAPMAAWMYHVCVGAHIPDDDEDALAAEHTQEDEPLVPSQAEKTAPKSEQH
ncbi:hypothetical protein Q1695_002237 [Nippostrongylus brasiliensis]|nr:hypothetical protein Q1695_002237 [Nippostrongylus brasiliensis]